MYDLLAADHGERLALPGGDLVFWPRVDLGDDYVTLLHRLIADSAWRQERITVYGKPYLQPRLSAWYGDLSYRYSGIRLEPLPWTPLLLELRRRVESLTGCDYNSVLLNYYRDGNDGMGMHSDDERELGPQPSIASLSLGETRDFVMRHRHRGDLDTLKLPLPAGSLLLMQGDTQRNWRHGIRKLRRACGPRLNLTFRRVFPPGDEGGAA
ncbi:MAG: alpha-ketoglutarate-dependent dioxygenase AlkB [Gammaproteobacteria bacterium]|jgi:alkylated DNA repair dioxygenase AlkB